MAFKKYTQCYNHTPGDKPFNKEDLAATVFAAGIPGFILAIVGLIVTSYLTLGIGVAMATITGIITVANEWLYHRLVCLTGVQCAVGKVIENPTVGGLGEFDNDQYFSIILIPHTGAEPVEEIHSDGLLGEKLLKRIIMDLPYGYDKEEAKTLHCEAEGDFWIKMKQWAALLAILIAATTLGAVAAGAAGGAAGAAAGCALGGFFGPIGCLIGAIIGAIIGALLAGGAVAAVGAAAIYGTLNILYNANQGNVEDANVGDKNLGPIKRDDKVIVYGEHVYDGFHEGWHEFHPLMAVLKLNESESSEYLEWNPDFNDGKDSLPKDTANMQPVIQNLSVDDMRQGLHSTKFRSRTEWLIDRWCKELKIIFTQTIRQAQALEENRWTIHPSIDGCLQSEHQGGIK